MNLFCWKIDICAFKIKRNLTQFVINWNEWDVSIWCWHNFVVSEISIDWSSTCSTEIRQIVNQLAILAMWHTFLYICKSLLKSDSKRPPYKSRSKSQNFLQPKRSLNSTPLSISPCEILFWIPRWEFLALIFNYDIKTLLSIHPNRTNSKTLLQSPRIENFYETFDTG